MTDFLRRLIFACIGLAVLIGALMASFFLGLALLAAFVLLWAYMKLRQAGVIKGPDFNHRHRRDHDQGQVIEAEYVVVEEKETREPEDRV